MIKELKNAYVAISNNQVTVFDTNLKTFVSQLNTVSKATRNYDWFFREFKKSNYFQAVIDGQEYYFQRIPTTKSDNKI